VTTSADPSASPTPSNLSIEPSRSVGRRFFRRVPRRETLPQEVERIMLDRAKEALKNNDTKTFDSLTAKLLAEKPSEREDGLDIYRVLATTLMVAALFAIVIVIVGENKTSNSDFQFVSLASGLAGIGLGWLFGTGATRRR